jgi:mono/diheme cytochrome c family protein
LLGVGALQLSTDRDPNAPHAEPVPAHGVDLRALVQRGLLGNLPGSLVEWPPRIHAETEAARAALGYLHANCGTCHTGAGELASLGFALNYDVAPPNGRGAHALFTAVGRQGKVRISSAPDAVELIRPGHPDQSILFARMASRHPVLQMPPLATRLVDAAAVAVLRRWIAEQAQPVPQFTPTKEEK